MTTSIDERQSPLNTHTRRQLTSSAKVLTECQGFHSATRKRMQQAENAIDTRSQDLRRAVAQLHKTVNYIRINRTHVLTSRARSH